MKENSFFERYKEILLGVFMFALALVYLYQTTFIRTRSTVSVSAKAIPELLGCIVIVLAVIQIVIGVKRLRAVESAGRSEGMAPVFFGKLAYETAKPVILTFIVILLYAFTFDWLGFIISSTLCMFLLMLVLAPRSKRRAGKFFAISLAVAVVVYLAFQKGLSLSLPRGVLEGVPLL